MKIATAKTVLAQTVIANNMTITEVWKNYHNDVHKFIISKVKDLSLADDLLQESFIKIHTKLYTLKDESKMKSWVFSIARNTIMDYFKTSKPHLETDEELAADEVDGLPLDHTVEDCLKQILQNMEKKYREPIYLHDIKGLKQNEVAEQLGLPLPTVKSQIQRGRKQIIQGFITCCGFEINAKGQLIGEVKPKEECRICK